MHEDIEFSFNKYSDTPKRYKAFTEDELREFKGVFPDYMVELQEVYGRYTFRNGMVHGCHPRDLRQILAVVFKADVQLNHKTWHAYAYTAFGKIYFYSPDFGKGIVNLLTGDVICRSLTKGTPKFPYKGLDAALADENELYDTSAKPMFKRALKKFGELEWGQCYGFVPALAMGGERTVSNLKRQENAFAHFAFLAQLQPFYLQDIQGISPDQQPRIREIG